MAFVVDQQLQQHVPRRKLKVLVISTEGSERQASIRALFEATSTMRSHFEAPVFSPSVSSRTLRNRVQFFQVAHEAGLIPEQEWEALQEQQLLHSAAISGESSHERDPGKFFDCLNGVPVLEGRRGSKSDIKLHYCKEIWYKAKTINRGRSVLGCALAHLIAMKRFVQEDFDILLEDNVRAPINERGCADLVRQAQSASEKLQADKGVECHFRFFGWLGSSTNLEYVLQIHATKRAYPPPPGGYDGDCNVGVFPFPLLQHLKEDLEDVDETENDPDEDEIPAVLDEKSSGITHARPGGNLVWGTYAYWISKLAYERLLETLRQDVGALLWKGKRARFYSVKPIDKVLPRQIMSLCGEESVQLTTHPAFFRAPMLTSRIHAKWDPEFCKSTEYQLEATGLSWDHLWLTDAERDAVKRRMKTGVWSVANPIELEEHY